VTGLVAISAFESQKSRASGISLASVDIVGLDTVTCVHGFGLSGIVANLAVRLLGVLGVGVSVGVHSLKISLLVVL
jgi:acyl dehydratase